MHVKGASGSRQTAMNDPGAQQPSPMFLTCVKARPQHRELRALLILKNRHLLYNLQTLQEDLHMKEVLHSFHGKTWAQQIDLLSTVWLHSSVG